MKKLLLIFLTTLGIYCANAQCEGFAGNDTTICDPFITPSLIQIGSLDNTIETSNYSFVWTAIFDTNIVYNQYFSNASDVLSNVNEFNPTINEIPFGTTQFILQTTDNLNNVCTDTVVLKITLVQACLAECIHGIDLGDSITLTNFCIFPTVLPVTVNEITVSPTQTTSYNITMTDGIGCEYSETCTVMVNPTSINETEKLAFKVLQNPFTNNLNFNINLNNLQKANYKILDLNGRLVNFGEVKSSNQINTETLLQGIYFLNIYEQNQLLLSEKLIKN